MKSEFIPLWNQVYEMIVKSEKILLTGHISSDGDTSGSQFAMADYLKSIGKEVRIIWGEEVPEAFHFLPNSEQVEVFTHVDDYDDFDLALVLDCGAMERTGSVRWILDEKTKFIVNIDHHKVNTMFGDVNIVDTKSVCIGEMLYRFFKLEKFYPDDEAMRKRIAMNLYVSIVSDTGNFTFNKVGAEIHRATADIIEWGIVPSEIHILLDQSKPYSYISLLRETLSRTEYYHDKKIALSYLILEDYEDEGRGEKTEGLINYLGMLKSVEVFVLIKEKNVRDFYSVSMRSKTDLDVSEIAESFGGGGHQRASGFRSGGVALDVLKERIVQSIENQMQSENS